MKKYLFAILLAIFTHTSHAEFVYPISAKKLKPMELGEAILLFMPDESLKNIYWDYRANDKNILWNTDGFKQEKLWNGEIQSFREGFIRIHVLGKKSSVLKKNKHELVWTVRYTTQINPKLGIKAISIAPGLTDEQCFGSLYEGCAFDIEDSLIKTGISVKKVCKERGAGFQILGYEISYPKRKRMFVRWNYNEGSGGSNANIELYTHSDNLCLF